MTPQTQLQASIWTLRRQVAGITLASLATRAGVPYQSAWRALVGGATPTAATSARIDAALDAAEAEHRDARRALAVLRGSFAADSPEGEDTRPPGHHGPRRPLSPSLAQRAIRLHRLAENGRRQVV